MRLPHLDQLVPLERGEAGLLARAVAVLVRDVTHSQTPVPLVELLTFAPLATLAKTLHQRHQREQLVPVRPGRRPLRPWQLRVRYDQLAALLHHRLALFYCGLSEAENLQLAGIVGKFQQKSLNLSTWIRFG
ncbi:MAG: hypothetical protein EOO57_10635 [Hymenobacter sp.]|nr:MAG: hypothetical protein EOO57_10635 [Hymenobacter sp.]